LLLKILMKNLLLLFSFLPSIRKSITYVVFFTFFMTHILAIPAWSGSFEDALAEGNALGQQGVTTYSPGSVDLPATVPRYNDAQSQKGNFTYYYTHPSEMQSHAEGEALTFTQDSYEQRQKFDLTEDTTFGNKCLERDEDNKCIMWSLSKDLITNTYPDCTKVLIPEYETSALQTCTGSIQVTPTPECNVRRYLYTQVESVPGPCENETIEIRPNQIYAVCKDNAEIYRVNKGTVSAFAGHYRYVMSALCGAIGGCTFCSMYCPTGYVVNSEEELPANAVYLGQGVADVYVVGGSGSRVGYGTWYKYYSVRHESTVERVFLLTDSNCSEENITRWTQECSIEDYALCDSSGMNCVYIIQNGEATGNTANITCQTHSSVIDNYVTQNCTTNCQQPLYDNCRADCKIYTNCTGCSTCGSCPGGCTTCGTCESCDENGNNCTGCTSCTSCGTCDDDYQVCNSSCDSTYTTCTNQCQADYNSCIAGCGSNQTCKDACAVTRDNCNTTCGNNRTSCYGNCDTEKQNCDAVCGGPLTCSSCTSCTVGYDEGCTDQCTNVYCQETCSNVTISGYTVCPTSNGRRCLDDCQGDSSCEATCVSTFLTPCQNTCQSNYTACINNCDPEYFYECQSGCTSTYNQCLNTCQGGYDHGLTLNQTEITSTPEYHTFTTSTNNIPITWQTVFGGPGVTGNLDDWYVKIKFKCRNQEDSCQALIDQGCVFYSQRCLDDACTQLEYTYKCGKDRITGYTVAYNCAGQIRCIGTDCKTVSYEANKDFAAAATAGEVLNMARVDSSRGEGDFIIFPGKPMQCQRSPENCCKSITGGLSIGDYAQAGYNAYSIYKDAIQGFNNVATSYAESITTIGNQIGTKLGITDIGTTFSINPEVSVYTYTESGFLGTQVTTSVSSGTYEAAASAVTPSGMVSAVGTIMAAVSLLYSAYSIATTLYEATFGCDTNDIQTSTYLGYHLCHYVGTKSKKRFGFVTQRWNVYCCFNSILARIIHEQGRPQIGMGWGSANSPNCRGFTTQELASLDFSKIDLSEYVQYVTHKTELSTADIERITNDVKAKIQGN